MANEIKDYGNREVKASVFTAYFSEKENAAALYDSIAGTSGTKPENIEYRTLEGVLFMARKNDLAFTVNKRVLVISEHQSTLNDNMPLRNLIYFGRTIESLIPSRDLYREHLIKIPTPEFYVFYNGVKDFPLEKEQKLSDAFINVQNPYMLELTTKVININREKGHSILTKCRPMAEYSAFMEYIRDYRGTGAGNAEAITQAIKRCRKEDIMTGFLDKHSSEVENMLFTQWNWDDALEVAREEAREDARKESWDDAKNEGKQEGLKEGREEGRKEGREEGREEGRKEGREEERKNTEFERMRADAAEAELRELKKRYGLAHD